MDNRFNEYLFKIQRVQNGMFMFMYPGIGSVIPVVYRDSQANEGLTPYLAGQKYAIRFYD